MTWLSQGLARRGHSVTLACFEDGREAPFYGPPVGVDLHYLDLLSTSSSRGAALASNARRVRRLRRLYTELEPQVVLSFSDRTNVLALAAGLASDWRVVVSERVDPRGVVLGRAWSWARRRLYPRCRRLVIQAEDVRRCFGPALLDLVRVIPNPALVSAGGPTEVPVRASKRLLAVGRLDPQKGFDLLIDAFSQTAARFPEWELLILGEGPSRGALEAMVARAGLEDRVLLPGRRPDPFPFYRGADLFALSSRFEGFPNSLIEAMGIGLPVVAAACTGSVAEIVEGGRSGLLVAPDSADAIASGLGALMGDAALRKRMATAARGVLERYHPDRILDLWETVLREAIR